MFLDSDDYWHENKLYEQIKNLKKIHFYHLRHVIMLMKIIKK